MRTWYELEPVERAKILNIYPGHYTEWYTTRNWQLVAGNVWTPDRAPKN